MMRILLSVVCLLIPLLVVGCDLTESEPPPTPIAITSTPTESAVQPTQAPPPTANPEAPSPGATPEPTIAEEPESGEINETIDQIETQVAELRELPLLDEISTEIIDRQELLDRVDDLIAEDYTPEQARVEALTYWLLGLIPDRDIDFYQLQLDLLGEQIAGYYDPETDELVVVTQTGELEVADKVTLAHEIVHALQDQHFDLVTIDEAAENADQSAATTALVEGDASFSMSAYIFEYLGPMELAELFGDSFAGGQDFEVLENAPRYVREGLLFPYQEGQAFVEALHNAGGYERVDTAFANPPLSTEQILHPEKYLDPNSDKPQPVESPDLTAALGEDWQRVDDDVLGEWDINIMLDENGASDSGEASRGWGGSHYAVYEHSNGSAVATLTTVWDSAEDLEQFKTAMDEMLADLDSAGDLKTDGERFMTVISDDQSVTFISGTEQGAVSAAAAAMQS